jgi:hypothetical protein
MHSRHIHEFYEAFRRLDAAAMKNAYATNARFEDPGFSLRGADEIGAMWAMLCDGVRKNGRDVWDIEVSGIEAAGDRGRAHWEPRYRFSATGRLVHNIIDARFTFNEAGRIVLHEDSFDFWRWARQALGPTGLLLGWTPLLRSAVRSKARRGLDAYRRQHTAAAPPA